MISIFVVCFVLLKINAQSYSSYLFVYFTGNTGVEESLHFGYSDDGFEYVALNSNNPILSSSTISASGGIRDPHILRAPDGNFYIVMTDMVSAKGWDSNHGIVMLKSSNLVDWTYSKVDIHTAFPELSNVNHMWAPETVYDPERKKLLIHFSMRSGTDPEVIYYSYANDDFTGLETLPQPLYIPTDKLACIDSHIYFYNGTYNLFYKAHGHGNGIKRAVSTTSNLVGTYELRNTSDIQPVSGNAEGPCVFKLNGEERFVLIYDLDPYRFSESTDGLKTFHNTTNRVLMNFNARHGTIIPITADEKAALIKKWG